MYNQSFLIRKSNQIVVVLTIIWGVTKFASPYFALPLWIFLLFLTEWKSIPLLAVIIASEIFIGIDSLLIGPFSIIQIIGIFLFLKTFNNFDFKYAKDKLFIILLLISLYFSLSYFSFFHKLTFSTINWIFAVVISLSVFNRNISLNNLLLIFRVLVLSVFFAILINTLVIIFLGDDNLMNHKFGFGNNRQISFYGILILPILNFLLINIKSRTNTKLIKFIFYFIIFYTVYTNSRLNTLILVIYMIYAIFFLKTQIFGKNLKRNFIFILIAGLIIGFVTTGGIKEFFFRKENTSNVKGINFSNIHLINDLLYELNDPDLGAVTSGRSLIYRNAIILILDKPLFGNGFLSWNSKENNYNTMITGRTGNRISMHSTLLQYFAETGIIGLLLYLSYLFFIFKRGKLFYKSNNIFLEQIGQILIWTSFFMLLGSTFDNHSLSYIMVHFVASIGVFYKGSTYKSLT